MHFCGSRQMLGELWSLGRSSAQSPGAAGSPGQRSSHLLFAHQPLEFAKTVHLAPHAVFGMPGQKPFRIALAEGLQSRAVGCDDIAVLRQWAAGGLRVGMALDLHEAHPARGMCRKARVIAERGNVDARRLCRVRQGDAIFDLDPSSVDREHHQVATPPVGAGGARSGAVSGIGVCSKARDRSDPAAGLWVSTGRHRTDGCQERQAGAGPGMFGAARLCVARADGPASPARRGAVMPAVRRRNRSAVRARSRIVA
ncbi:hypothetical protein SAMN05421539_10384 [Jannaschia seohaensis]|uniref:Uncharacterized protein n=1 Tax=Jannaschia seohaensis TaxID=475081 RepID=A0A2Y9AIZ7_9RHOB|nr:hypothetical protein BCF38_10384 [Jannaschia seohaensis]SSA44280.1 hypothetical protein SAMN05421539_10384 [Jannaschia seohaensis]